MSLQKIALYFSQIATFFASWIVIETMFSSYNWWYYQENDGLKIGLLFFISAPLYIVAFILRKTSCKWNDVELYLDTLIPILLVTLSLVLKNEFIALALTLIPLLLSIITFILLLEKWTYKLRVISFYFAGCFFALLSFYFFLIY